MSKQLQYYALIGLDPEQSFNTQHIKPEQNRENQRTGRVSRVLSSLGRPDQSPDRRGKNQNKHNQIRETRRGLTLSFFHVISFRYLSDITFRDQQCLGLFRRAPIADLPTTRFLPVLLGCS